MRYQLIDHTADVMVRCEGKTLEECYENAAFALFDQMVDTEKIETKITRELSISEEGEEEKLYSFLSELLFIMETESLVFKDFKVTFDGDNVRCAAMGEKLDLKKHRPKTEVKAITYHELSVNRNIPCVTVIFDV